MTSDANNGEVGLPEGITSVQSSSLHSYGAVVTLSTVSVRDISSENVAVKEISLPLAGNTTLVNVYGDVKPETETDAEPSPVKSNVPVAGGL